MNESVKTEMRNELLKAHEGIGILAGIVCFVALLIVFSLIPGIPELTQNHKWPVVVVMAISCLFGSVFGNWRTETHRHRIFSYDDDKLKLEHDRLREKRLRSYVFWCVAIALVIAYFLLR